MVAFFGRGLAEMREGASRERRERRVGACIVVVVIGGLLGSECGGASGCRRAVVLSC